MRYYCIVSCFNEPFEVAWNSYDPKMSIRHLFGLLLLHSCDRFMDIVMKRARLVAMRKDVKQLQDCRYDSETIDFPMLCRGDISIVKFFKGPNFNNTKFVDLILVNELCRYSINSYYDDLYALVTVVDDVSVSLLRFLLRDVIHIIFDKILFKRRVKLNWSFWFVIDFLLSRQFGKQVPGVLCRGFYGNLIIDNVQLFRLTSSISQGYDEIIGLITILRKFDKDLVYVMLSLTGDMVFLVYYYKANLYCELMNRFYDEHTLGEHFKYTITYRSVLTSFQLFKFEEIVITYNSATGLVEMTSRANFEKGKVYFETIIAV